MDDDMPRKSGLELTGDGPERLGRAIMVRRAVLRLDRKDLAAKAGLSYPYVHQIETGTRTPSVSALRRMATVLDMTDSDLLTLADDMPALEDAKRITGRS